MSGETGCAVFDKSKVVEPRVTKATSKLKQST